MFQDIGMGNVFFKLSQAQETKGKYMNLHNVIIVKETVQQQWIEWDTMYTFDIMLISKIYKTLQNLNRKNIFKMI